MATCSDISLRSGKPPKLRDLFSLWLNDWYRVGEKLDVDKETLNRLRDVHSDNVVECKKRMFGAWLRDHQNPSYEVVMQALLDSGENRAAEELHQNHGISFSKSLQSRVTESRKQLNHVSIVLSGPDHGTKGSIHNIFDEYIEETENKKWRRKMEQIYPFLRNNLWFHDVIQQCLAVDFSNIQFWFSVNLEEDLEVNEIGPLLLNTKSFQFVCLDARENLAKPVKQRKETTTTVGDIVHQALHTIGSIWNKMGQLSHRAFGSAVVGTFSTNDSKERAVSVNAALELSLEECGCCQGNEIKYCHFRTGTIIFPLAKESPEHDEHIKSVLRQVGRYDRWRADVDSSIYKFVYLCWQRGGILKISECESFMNACGISSDELPRILRYSHYHSGLILHYADIPSLKELVICNPQVVIDGLIQLIGNINLFENNAHTTGEISKATLNLAVNEESLSSLQIISLLEYYHISSEIQQNVCFLPFLLPFDPSVNQASKATSAILKMLYPVPIAIHFLNSQVPAGIFYALVCQLSKSWKLANQPRYKNRITFVIENAISCSLLNHTAFIEVRVNGALRSTPFVLFRYIIQEISEILSYVIGFFKHTENSEFKIDFFCPNSVNNSLHIAEFNKDQSQIKCEQFLCKGQVIPVEENYAAWFIFENEEGSVLFGQSASWQAARGENEEVLELIQEHIEQEGSIKLRIVKSLFFGPPSVGKTTTRKRMTGEIVNLSTSGPPTSTGIDNPITVSLYHESAVLITDSDQWKEQNIESQADMLINHLLQAGKHPSKPTPTASPYISHSNSSHKLQQHHLELMETSVETSHVSSPKSFNPQDSLQQERKSSLSSVRFSSLASQSMGGSLLHSVPVALPFLTRMVQERRWKELKELFQNIKDFTLLQMIDIGGQPEFQEILPLLLSGPALYLTFINLTQELDNTYEVTYTQQDHSRSPITYRSQYTIKEILLQIYTTIASMNSGNQRSTAFLLGTYRDQVTTESIANLENQVSTSSLNDFIRGGILYRALPHLGKCIYPLDNMSGDREEIKILQSQLATHIQTKFQPQSLPTS